MLDDEYTVCEFEKRYGLGIGSPGFSNRTSARAKNNQSCVYVLDCAFGGAEKTSSGGARAAAAEINAQADEICDAIKAYLRFCTGVYKKAWSKEKTAWSI